MSNDMSKAPEHIKLAVDLIMLLEQNQVEPANVLAALDIVKHDYETKLAKQPLPNDAIK